MSGGKSDDFELEDSFIDDEGGAGFDSDDVSKTNSVKNSLVKRREIDEMLEERRLKKKLTDYDYDLDDDTK